MASFKKLSKSDVTLVPYYANKQWNLSYCPYPTSSEYLTIYNGTNLTGSFLSDSDPVTEGQYDRLVYSQINQLFYQKYTTPLNTSSLVNSIYYESASQQRPTHSYFIYNDSARLIENFPTGAMEGIRVLAVNQDIYGDKVLPNHFQLSSSAYNIIDDGYGNLYDGIITGSQQSTNVAYASDGVKLYSPGYNTDGTGTNISWDTSNNGGSYTGTFWTNPVTANKTGRLNYTGLWSGKSVYYLGTGTLTFNITAASNTTYYFGIGCDNLASLYLDNTLIVAQSYPDGTGANFRYWHIYPVAVSAGNHVIKLIGENAGIPSPGNPGSMGIEIYNNTETQISASIAASPNGATVPAGINLVYSSKDHLTEGNFDNQYATHVGNLFYAHGLGIITNQDYQMMFPLPPIAKNDYGSFLTTDTKTISASLNDYARSGTLNTGSLTFSGSTSGNGYSWATGSRGTIVLTTSLPGTYEVWYTIGADIAGSCAVQLRSNKAKVTAVVTEPTTTTSTTTTTTTAPTTTTSTTTSTTTAPTTTTTTTTTTSTTTSTTTAAPTTTSTTTSTTTAAPTTTTTTTTTSTTTSTTTTPPLYLRVSNNDSFSTSTVCGANTNYTGRVTATLYNAYSGGNPITNTTGNNITITVATYYTQNNCPGGASAPGPVLTITIPNGSSSGYVEYTHISWEQCGQDTTCYSVQLDVDSIGYISGYNGTLDLEDGTNVSQMTIMDIVANYIDTSSDDVKFQLYFSTGTTEELTVNRIRVDGYDTTNCGSTATAFAEYIGTTITYAPAYVTFIPLNPTTITGYWNTGTGGQPIRYTIRDIQINSQNITSTGGIIFIQNIGGGQFFNVRYRTCSDDSSVPF